MSDWLNSAVARRRYGIAAVHRRLRSVVIFIIIIIITIFISFFCFISLLLMVVRYSSISCGWLGLFFFLFFFSFYNGELQLSLVQEFAIFLRLLFILTNSRILTNFKTRNEFYFLLFWVLTHQSTAFLPCANWKFSDLLIVIRKLIHVGYQQSK